MASRGRYREPAPPPRREKILGGPPPINPAHFRNTYLKFYAMSPEKYQVAYDRTLGGYGIDPRDTSIITRFTRRYLEFLKHKDLRRLYQEMKRELDRDQGEDLSRFRRRLLTPTREEETDRQRNS